MSVLLLAAFVSESSAQRRVWIVFRDKGIQPSEFVPHSSAFDEAVSRLTTAATKRRECSRAPLVTLADARLEPRYLDSIRMVGVEPSVISRWTNAISATITEEQLATLLRLVCVKEILPVGRATLNSVNDLSGLNIVTDRESVTLDSSNTPCGYDSVIYHYGGAQSQLDRINVWPLHAMGIDATGVRLGSLDTGFRWRALESLRTRHIGFEHDYVFADTLTANEANDVPDQDGHGTGTLSTAIGYDPDFTIGPAYNATVFLAKTEDLRSETPLEEDNYAAALEDMERLGVDITTSSLGYFNFDAPFTSYLYSDMNGHTTISARAALEAARKGVLVVTAMGNNGAQSEPHLNTPADADSIISVGALDAAEQRADFSSIGPTSDGRLKPEICAPGVGVHAQAADRSYGDFTGTSFATPLVSSACCLIKQAHPEATAQQIRQAVMSTGSQASTPDNRTGYGRLNTYAAALRLGPILRTIRVAADHDSLRFCVGAASEQGVGSIVLEHHTTIDFHPFGMQLSRVADSLIYSGAIGTSANEQVVYYRIILTDGEGVSTFSQFDSVRVGVAGVERERPLAALAVYPNPAVDRITVRTELPGTLELIDPLGRRVSEHYIPFGVTEVAYDVRHVASGTYLVRMLANNGSIGQRAIVVHH